MALKLNEAYPGRFNNPSPEYPQGSFKNRTTPTAEDGSYFEQQWANDHLAFLSSLLDDAVIEPNGLVDEVGASQYFDAFLASSLKLLRSAAANSTELLRGSVALASQAEAEAGAENTKAMTPLRVFQAIRSAAANATELLRGVLRVGTQAEVNAGALDNVAVTPAKLKAALLPTYSFGDNGYFFLPQILLGFGFQWGRFAHTAGTNAIALSVNFPVAFPNSFFFGIPISDSGNTCMDINAVSLNSFGFNLTARDNGGTFVSGAIYWFAIGR